MTECPPTCRIWPERFMESRREARMVPWLIKRVLTQQRSTDELMEHGGVREGVISPEKRREGHQRDREG